MAARLSILRRLPRVVHDEPRAVDGLWIGVCLMLARAPVAGAVTIVRMVRAWERVNAADGELRSEVVVVDSAGSCSAGAAVEEAANQER